MHNWWNVNEVNKLYQNNFFILMMYCNCVQVVTPGKAGGKCPRLPFTISCECVIILK